MPTIAEAAAAALAAQQAAEAALLEQMRQALVEIVRQTIAVRLSPLDAAALTVVHVDIDGDLAVLTDGQVCLAGTDDGRVFLVEDRSGWTRVSPPLASLAHLGEVLAAG